MSGTEKDVGVFVSGPVIGEPVAGALVGAPGVMGVDVDGARVGASVGAVVTGAVVSGPSEIRCGHRHRNGSRYWCRRHRR